MKLTAKHKPKIVPTRDRFPTITGDQSTTLLVDQILKQVAMFKELRGKLALNKGELEARTASAFYDILRSNSDTKTVKVLGETGAILVIHQSRCGDINPHEVNKCIGNKNFQRWFRHVTTLDMDLAEVPAKVRGKVVREIFAVLENHKQGNCAKLGRKLVPTKEFWSERSELPTGKNIELDEIIKPVRQIKPV